MSYLIDTDIIIYSLKGNETVRKWMVGNQNIPKHISVISYGELVYGARKSSHPEKNIATVNRIAQLFHIVDINKEIMEVFGEMKAKQQTKGLVVADMDMLIASTAIYLNYSLVTNNKKHFRKIDELIIEDWENYA